MVKRIEPRNCKQCGRLIENPDHSTRIFCSQTCFGKWNSENKIGENHPTYSRVERICEQCGKSFIVKKCETVKGWGKFCGRKCKAEWQKINAVGENGGNWRGGRITYYGPNWYQQRRNARHRDHYICQRCGISEKELGVQLSVHHIVPFRKNADYLQANRMANLVSLCHSCHSFVEAHGLQPQS